jgi:hypothetical protein
MEGNYRAECCVCLIFLQPDSPGIRLLLSFVLMWTVGASSCRAPWPSSTSEEGQQPSATLSPLFTSPILLSFHRTKCEELCSGTRAQEEKPGE